MANRTRAVGSHACCSIILAGCLVAGSVVAQTTDELLWVYGNSANNQISVPDWDLGVSEQLNTDASRFASLRSFAFRANTCDAQIGVEILAADTNRDWLVRYTGADDYAVADIFCDSTITGCPARPEGLSLSSDGRLAVASTGAGGSLPSVTLFDPVPCDEPSPPATFPYQSPRSTGQVCLGSGGVCDTNVVGVVDTAFVRVPGGGLNTGDLLILTSGPTSLAFVRGDDLPPSDQAQTPSFTVAEVIADAAVFGGGATSLTIVPGTGGAGDINTNSQSEDTLVTVAGGVVKVLRFQKDNNGAPQLTGPPADLFTQPLGNGPLGITAGVIQSQTFVGLARRNEGTVNRYELFVDGATGNITNIPIDPASGDAVTDGQNPQDIAIQSEVLNAEDCDIFLEPEFPDDEIGCEFAASRETFTQDTTPLQSIASDIRAVPVPCDLEPPVDFFDLGLADQPGEFVIPYHTLPIPLGDDDSCVYVYAAFEDDITMEHGEVIFTDALVESLFPELGSCRDEFFTIVYHPDRDAGGPGDIPYGNGGVLYPIDFVCQNPPKGLKRDNSPSIFGRNAFLARKASGTRQDLRGIDKDIKNEANARLDALLDVIAFGMSDTPPYDVAKAQITALLEDVAQLIKRKKWADASDQTDLAILAIEAERDSPGAFSSAAGVRETLYGDVQGLALNLSYFLWEVGAEGIYCPPVPTIPAVTCTGKTL